MMSARPSLVAFMAMAVLLAAAPTALAQPGREPNCADPLFQAEINMCAEADYRAADAAMNAVLAEAIAQFAEQDRAYAEEGPLYVGAEEALRESQDAWTRNRGDFCAARSLTFAGGSMRPAVHFACLAMITRSRMDELSWLLD